MTHSVKIALWILPGLLGAAVVGLLAGCEGDTNDDVSGAAQYFKTNPYSSEPREDPAAPTLDIEPSLFVVTYVGQRVVFSVSGGEGDYRWSLSHWANGDLVAQGANQAIYTVRRVEDNSVTALDDAGHFAVAYIKTTASTNDTLSVSPSQVALAAGESHASFTVSGGYAPYTWTAGNVQLGTVSYSAASSHVASYTAVAGAYGQNVITVTDANGRRAYATVTQTQ